MIDFQTALKLAEEVLSSLEKIYHLIHPLQTTAVAREQMDLSIPTLLQLRRRLLGIHARRHLVTELVATGKLSQDEAQAMVDAGSVPAADGVGATTAPFANIIAWLQANSPTIAADIVAAIPILVSLITLFGG